MTRDPPEDAVVRTTAPTLATVARGVSWKGAGRAVGQLTWLGSVFVLAALLSPKDFGIVAVGTTVVTVTNLIMEAGTGGGIIVTPGVSAEQLRASVARNFGVGSALTLVLILLAGPIADTFAQGTDPDVLRVMVLSIAVAALGIVPLAVLDKTFQFKRRAQVTVVAGVLSSACAVTAALLGAGVWSLVARQLLNQLLLTALAWLAVRRVWPRGRLSGAAARRVRTGATWFFIMASSQFAAFSLDNLIVGRVAGLAQLGLYSLAFTLAFAPLLQIAYEVGGVLLPAMAATEDRELVRSRTLKAMRMMAMVMLPWGAPAVVLAPVLIPAVLGEKWEGMVTPFQIMIVAALCHAVTIVMGETLAASGSVAYRARIDAVWAAATVGAVILLTHANGITGAATAHLVMWVFYAAGYAVGGWLRVGIPLARQAAALSGVLGAVAAQALVTTGVWLVADGLGASESLAAAAAAAAGLAVAFALLARHSAAPLREGRDAFVAAVRGGTA